MSQFKIQNQRLLSLSRERVIHCKIVIYLLVTIVPYGTVRYRIVPYDHNFFSNIRVVVNTFFVEKVVAEICTVRTVPLVRIWNESLVESLL